jgi:hypothetical protein
MSRPAFLSAFSANGGHVFAVLAYGNATFATRLAGLVGGKFVGSPLHMSGSAPFACYFTLFFAVH